MHRLLGQQSGQALALVMAFMVLAVPLITSALAVASTLSVDSQVKTRILKSQYTLLACEQWAAHILRDVQTAFTTSTVFNGRTCTATATKTSPPAGSAPIPPGAESGREFRATKIVSPATSTPNVATTYTYTIHVQNTGLAPLELTTVHDELDVGVSYVTSSTSGVTSDEPQISGSELKWDSLAYTVPAGTSTTLSFQATASRPEGVYCNEAWVDPGGFPKSTASGLTAPITVGSPSSYTCSGPTAKVTKVVDRDVVVAGTSETVTYTIFVENHGGSTILLKEIRDLLPEDWDYDPGSSSGITTSDPSVLSYESDDKIGRW